MEDAIQDALTELGLENAPALLLPDAKRPGYRLFVGHASPPVSSLAIRNAVEARLITNPYYEHAIRIGQLRPLAATTIQRPGELIQAFEDHLASRGIRTGDIKPTVLVSTQHADGVLNRLFRSGGNNETAATAEA